MLVGVLQFVCIVDDELAPRMKPNAAGEPSEFSFVYGNLIFPFYWVSIVDWRRDKNDVYGVAVYACRSDRFALVFKKIIKKSFNRLAYHCCRVFILLYFIILSTIANVCLLSCISLFPTLSNRTWQNENYTWPWSTVLVLVFCRVVNKNYENLLIANSMGSNRSNLTV